MKLDSQLPKTGPVYILRIWLPASLGLSALGLVLHNLMEFGVSGLFAPETSTVPMVLIAVALAAGWWLLPRLRPICTALMLTYAGLNLVGGAILSVLPLPFLPFAPDQSLSHYAVHGLYGLAQLPLIWLATRVLFFKQTATNS